METELLISAGAVAALVLLVWQAGRCSASRSKIGRPGSEDRLIQALSRFGDKLMAEDFLSCGAPELAKGARRWTERRGYRITHRTAGQSATWGEF